jgi:PAS domain S-box-containing protein
MPAIRWRPVSRFAAALAATAVAIAIRGAFDPILGERHPFGFLYAAVAFAVWEAGWLPAVVAAVAGYVASDFWFIAPRGSVSLSRGHEWFSVAAYSVCSAVVIILGESLRRSRRTYWKQAVELRAAREQLQIVVDSISAPVTRCNRDLEYVWVSRGYAEWLKRPAEAIVGRPITDILGPAAFQKLRPCIERVLAGETVWSEEEVEVQEMGPRWVQAVYAPTRDANGEVDGWVAVIVDVDRPKRLAEDLRSADRRKNEFLAVLAHELRNPLAPIRNAVRYLKEVGPPQKDLQDAREIIDRQVDQMIRLVDDLLELSRITQRMVEVRKVRMELTPVVHTAVEAARPMIQARRHELSVSIPEEPIWLEADPVRLAQVLSNLLQNAAKYTDPGGHIWVAVRRDGREVVFSVRDTGIGLAPESLDSIFEMFTQVSSVEQRKEGGLGIGLALVRGLVELHGGTVEARSAGLGQGSEFVVRLPAPAARGFPAGVPGQVAAPSARGSRQRILVVDDNHDSADSLRMLLALHGHEIRTAYDGVHALAEVDEFRPGIVLLDIGLPRMDGYEVARAIRQRPWGERVVLVALTGWGLDDDRRRAREAGFDHHITKPAEVTDLENLLRSAAERLRTPAA